jgi:adenylate kinase family enzyme
MIILIIGNAGCGKSYLGKRLSNDLTIPLFCIDFIWFKPGGYSKDHERTAKERSIVMKNIMTNKSYIIEGASGLTAKKFAKVATHLIFIKYPKSVCLKSIRSRKLPSGQISSKSQTDWLYNFAREYYEKKNTGSCSLYTHKNIVDKFKKSIYTITSRDDANRLML